MADADEPKLQDSAAGLTMASAEKEQLTAHNRELLEADLAAGRLRFESRPRVVELQLSNFCNMSCIMCYDGVNPTLERIDVEFVRKIAAEVLPGASVLVPFATSEPLITTWPLSVELARQYGVEMEITTNVQFLDQKKCEEMADHVTRVIFSIDSHIPEVFETIRLKGRADKVFENLPKAAQFFRERGIEVVTNIVFMMQTVPFLNETVAWLADHGVELVHIQKLFYDPAKAKLAFSDPLAHLSPEYILDLKARLRATAKAKGIALIFDFDGSEVCDFRPPNPLLRASATRDDWLEKLRNHHPGYCPQSVYRLKVDSRGKAYPCCVGVEGRLELGDITTESFEDIWNGPTSQDLRRGMISDDLPKICQDCNFRTGPILPEMQQRQFCDDHFIWMESHPERWCLEVLSPPHLHRSLEPPTFSWSPAPTPVDYYQLVFSRGGEKADFWIGLPTTMTSFVPPLDQWQEIQSNVAYWWTVYAIVDGMRQQSYRGNVLRCLFRHEDLPRIAGSNLNYDF